MAVKKKTTTRKRKPTKSKTTSKTKSKAKYLGASKKTKYGTIKSRTKKRSASNLEKDASRKASPAGRRVSKAGNKYTENRPNRSDILGVI